MPDVLEVDGIDAVQRFQLAQLEDSDHPNRWLAIYEVTGDLETVQADLAAKAAGMEFSPHYLPELTVRYAFSPISPRYSHQDPPA